MVWCSTHVLLPFDVTKGQQSSHEHSLPDVRPPYGGSNNPF